jgi:predicted RNA polymerase sigma factor
VNRAEITNEEPQEVSQIVEHLFRHESGRMIATLTAIFGIEHLTLAEDVVQEALTRALQTWPFYGVPENPAAWIMRASRNLALDVVRREKVFPRQGNADHPPDDATESGIRPGGFLGRGN